MNSLKLPQESTVQDDVIFVGSTQTTDMYQSRGIGASSSSQAEEIMPNTKLE